MIDPIQDPNNNNIINPTRSCNVRNITANSVVRTRRSLTITRSSFYSIRVRNIIGESCSSCHTWFSTNVYGPVHHSLVVEYGVVRVQLCTFAMNRIRGALILSWLGSLEVFQSTCVHSKKMTAPALYHL